MSRGRAAGWLAVALLVGGWGALERPDPEVERGTEAYARGEFERALQHFSGAGADADGARVEFDRGTALYKMSLVAKGTRRDALFDQAEAAFRRAAEAPDGVLRSAAYYNLGNTLYQRERFAEAAQAYRRALRANPRNDDARYNLELCLRRLGRDAPPPTANGAGTPPPDAAGQPEGRPEGQPGAPSPDPDGEGAPPEGRPPDGDGASATEPSAPPGQPPPGEPPAPEPPGPAPALPPPPPPGGDPGSDRKVDRGAPGDADGDGRIGESERKLERLERRSRELRRRLLRGAKGGYDRARAARDW